MIWYFEPPTKRTDGTDLNEIDSYIIMVNDVEQEERLPGNATEIDVDLPPGTYCVQLQTVDKLGNVSQLSSKDCKTQEEPNPADPLPPVWLDEVIPPVEPPTVPGDFSPNMYKTFEGGTVGQPAIGNDAFYYTASAASDPLYSNSYADTGSLSGKCEVGALHVSSGDPWGGGFTNDSKLMAQDGQEFWIKASTYYPAGFNFACAAGEGIKFMRIQLYSQSDVSYGTWLYNISGGGLNAASGMILASDLNDPLTSEFYTRHPYDGQYRPTIQKLGEPIVTGQWYYHDIYMKLGSNNNGIHRYYQNGVLLLEEENVNTCPVGAYVRGFQLWTHWNFGAPQVQSAYADNFAYSLVTPPNLGSDGNPIIGNWAP